MKQEKRDYLLCWLVLGLMAVAALSYYVGFDQGIVTERKRAFCRGVDDGLWFVDYTKKKPTNQDVWNMYQNYDREMREN